MLRYDWTGCRGPVLNLDFNGILPSPELENQDSHEAMVCREGVHAVLATDEEARTIATPSLAFVLYHSEHPCFRSSRKSLCFTLLRRSRFVTNQREIIESIASIVEKVAKSYAQVMHLLHPLLVEVNPYSRRKKREHRIFLFERSPIIILHVLEIAT